MPDSNRRPIDAGIRGSFTCPICRDTMGYHSVTDHSGYDREIAHVWKCEQCPAIMFEWSGEPYEAIAIGKFCGFDALPEGSLADLHSEIGILNETINSIIKALKSEDPDTLRVANALAVWQGSSKGGSDAEEARGS